MIILNNTGKMCLEKKQQQKMKSVGEFLQKKFLQECISMQFPLIHIDHVERQIYVFQDNWTDEVVSQYTYNMLQQFRQY